MLGPGSEVFNAINDRPGTVGVLAQDSAGAAYLITCYHVLGRSDMSDCQANEPILQRYADGTASVVAQLDAGRMDRDLDCAAARIVGGVPLSSVIPTIGDLGPNADTPSRVAKYGVETKYTEGRIHRVVGTTYQIRAPSDAPRARISARGDSGALWVDASTHGPVALHFGTRRGAVVVALAVDIRAVLAALRLEIL